ncbi:hypothetical protein ACFXTH_000808 [Malus domestica]
MVTKEASVVVATKMVKNPPPEPVTTDTADNKTATKASKAKEPKAKKAPASRKPRSAPIHPPYEETVKEAIVMLKEMTGSSQYTITKYIEEKHNQLPPNFKNLLLFHLKKLVSSNKIVKVKNSFKLSLKRCVENESHIDENESHIDENESHIDERKDLAWTSK